MKLISTKKYNGKVNSISYRCNIYEVRIFSKILKFSTNYIYGGGDIPTWRETVLKVLC